MVKQPSNTVACGDRLWAIAPTPWPLSLPHSGAVRTTLRTQSVVSTPWHCQGGAVIDGLLASPRVVV